MDILESAMAFAVVFIILSTIVTGVVEFLLRVSGMRQKNLRSTVASLFESVVWPRLSPRLSAVAKDKETVLSDFLKGMTQNPALAPPPTADSAVEDTGWRRFRRRALTILQRLSFTHTEAIDYLTPLAFVERLARTDVGQAIVAEGRQEMEILVQDFVRTFDRYGRASSEVFRKHAQVTAMVVGIAFAFAANVDASRLFSGLMSNPDLRTGLIEQADAAATANREAAEQLEALANRIASGDLPDDAAEEIKKSAAEIKSSFDDVKAKGLPIGHELYPYCRNGAAGDERCGEQGDHGLVAWVRWALFTFISGILIGLGGPFWFRVFSSLSQVFQVLRSFGIGNKPQQAQPEQLDATPAAETSFKPKDVLDAFRTAAHVHAAAAEVALFPATRLDGRRFID